MMPTVMAVNAPMVEMRVKSETILLLLLLLLLFWIVLVIESIEIEDEGDIKWKIQMKDKIVES